MVECRVSCGYSSGGWVIIWELVGDWMDHHFSLAG